MKNKQLPTKLPVRIIVLVLGLFCIAFGVALSTKSGLGVSPSAAIPYVLCQVTPLSMGFITTVINVLMVVAQVVILRRDFKPIQFLQLVIVFVFGYFTDWTLSLVADMNISNYFLKLLLTLIGCALMGLGVYLEVEANLITLSSDGLTTTINNKTHINFGLIKNIIDGSQVIIAAICSVILLHTLFGMREGTIITAVLVGLFVQFYSNKFGFFHRWLNTEKAEFDFSAVVGLTSKMEALIDSPEEDLAKMAEVPHTYPLIITIDCEYGSGGHVLGKAIAEQLGIKYYDHEYLHKEGLKRGLTADMLNQNSADLPEGMIHSIYKSSFAASRNIRVEDQVFKTMSRIIRDIANSGESCVIMGRLSNHILNPRPNCFNLFVSADYDFRAVYLEKFYNYEKAEAVKLIRREDIARSKFCQHFTGSVWGLSRHFTMTVDTSVYGFDKATELVIAAIKAGDYPIVTR